jgi:hypothetical protein
VVACPQRCCTRITAQLAAGTCSSCCRWAKVPGLRQQQQQQQQMGHASKPNVMSATHAMVVHLSMSYQLQLTCCLAAACDKVNDWQRATCKAAINTEADAGLTIVGWLLLVQPATTTHPITWCWSSSGIHKRPSLQVHVQGCCCGEARSPSAQITSRSCVARSAQSNPISAAWHTALLVMLHFYSDALKGCECGYPHVEGSHGLRGLIPVGHRRCCCGGVIASSCAIVTC